MAEDRYCIRVDVGDGAVMSIPKHALEYDLRYSKDGKTNMEARLSAASIVECYLHMVSPTMSMKEATRRLRIMRRAVREG